MKSKFKLALILLAGMIIWRRPDGSVAITTVIEGTAQEESAKLQQRGDVPSDWQPVAIDPARGVIPTDKRRRNAWVWDGQKIVDDVTRSTAPAAVIGAPRN